MRSSRVLLWGLLLFCFTTAIGGKAGCHRLFWCPTTCLTKICPLRIWDVDICPYGFVLMNNRFDTRQIVGDRDGNLLFFPRPFEPDVNGSDINNVPDLYFTMIQTQIGLHLKFPCFRDYYSACGIIEGDFRGQALPLFSNFSDQVFREVEELTRVFKFRILMGEISWPTGSFLFGQYWHPLFVWDCWPQTVSYNAGSPITTGKRDPQLRLTFRWPKYELILAAVTQGNFTSFGPFGESNLYIRRAAVPNLNGQIRRCFKRGFIGAILDFKRIRPRIVTETGFKTSEFINSIIAAGYMRLNLPPTICVKVTYSQNAADHFMLSGYAVETQDPITNVQTYANTEAASVWIDIWQRYCKEVIEIGLFAGYSKNLGSRKELFIDPETGVPIIFDFLDQVDNLDYVSRISPRFVYLDDAFRVGLELEWTRAAFGFPDSRARPVDAIPVNNVRFVCDLAYYY